MVPRIPEESWSDGRAMADTQRYRVVSCRPIAHHEAASTESDYEPAPIHAPDDQRRGRRDLPRLPGRTPRLLPAGRRPPDVQALARREFHRYPNQGNLLVLRTCLDLERRPPIAKKSTPALARLA